MCVMLTGSPAAMGTLLGGEQQNAFPNRVVVPDFTAEEVASVVRERA